MAPTGNSGVTAYAMWREGGGRCGSDRSSD